MSRDREDEPGFASRWSRRKQKAKAEPAADPEAEAAAADPPIDDERSDEEVLEELGLPDPDTMKPGDNFAAFMARAVPARIRNRALRKLWVSDPVLANLDMLLDYGEDFTDKAMVIENLQTAYQVGKGFVDKVAEVSGEDVGSAEQPTEEPAEASDEAGEETGADEADPAGLAEEVAPENAPEDTGEKAVPEERIRVRQRMRFRVAEE